MSDFVHAMGKLCRFHGQLARIHGYNRAAGTFLVRFLDGTTGRLHWSTVEVLG